MLLARVIGNVVSTKKDEAMQGRKLLLLRPLLLPLRQRCRRLLPLTMAPVAAGPGGSRFCVFWHARSYHS